ncbi:hypothetical protein [Mucilaginibacter sp.]|jgi:hypothetical protein|uniref:hypothetical protein n=1 Tax=Mucilaginibacter sp. TaxID=1882438 RepID=UPI00356B4707
MPGRKPANPLVVILIASLIAGTLDGLAAIFILAKGEAALVFKYIASAIYGKAAFAGGVGMVYTGIVFHYLIATCFTILFFIMYGFIPLVRKSLYLVTVLYGVFIWVVMNLLVLPITQIKNIITLEGALKNILILIICVALPIVLISYRYERLKVK